MLVKRCYQCLISRFRWGQLQTSLFCNPNRKVQNSKYTETELKKLEYATTVAGEKELNLVYDDIFERNTPSGDDAKAHAENPCGHFGTQGFSARRDGRYNKGIISIIYLEIV